MANIVPKKNHRGAVRGWEIRTKLTTDKGAAFTFYASAATFEASDVEGLKALLSDCEKDAAKTGAIQPFTLGRLEPFPFLLDALADKGVIDAAPFAMLGDVCSNALADLERTAKPRTIRTARYSLRRLLEYFKKEKPILAITQRDALAFSAYLSEKVEAGEMAQTSKNAVIIRAKWLFNWYGLQTSEPFANPFQSVKGGSTVSEKGTRVITEEEAARILGVIASYKPKKTFYDSLEWKAWFFLGYRQGLRLNSEAPELKWEFIDFNNGVLLIKDVKRSKRSKGAKWRKMPLFRDTAAALWELKEERKRNGDALDFVLSDWWKRDAEIVGACAYCHLQTIYQAANVNPERARQVLRQTASNRIRDEYGEYWENLWLGHSQSVARGAYYSDDIPKEILNKIPSWEKVATE